jgi:hypothetical protein
MRVLLEKEPAICRTRIKGDYIVISIFWGTNLKRILGGAFDRLFIFL